MLVGRGGGGRVLCQVVRSTHTQTLNYLWTRLTVASFSSRNTLRTVKRCPLNVISKLTLLQAAGINRQW